MKKLVFAGPQQKRKQVKAWDKITHMSGGEFHFRWISITCPDLIIVSELGDDTKFRQFHPAEFDLEIVEPAQ